MSSESKAEALKAVNDFVIRFANINGTGSWSANFLLAKALFRMGIPVGLKNIFPSNIQGLPTWYEVRVSEKGYIGTRGDGVDIMLSVNPQSLKQDIECVMRDGYFIYDNSKPLAPHLKRDDINFIGLPLTAICISEYDDPKLRLLFKNIIYIGALAAFIDVEMGILKGLVSEKFAGKDKLIKSNHHALDLGYAYAKENFTCPMGLRVEARDLVGDAILMDGNQALALGAIYGGASVAAWYPITPSTSVIDNFRKHARSLRIDPYTGKKNYAIIQAEDELSAIGMVLGATWNGARAFTATSGPGVSLMSEFLGYAYFAELPAVLFNVQRAGPSTGMPTRTQQSDLTICAYASHGDTKHVLLFPSTPSECFEMAVLSFDLADRLQTPVMVMSDLDLGMNEMMCDPLSWDDDQHYDRGKVLFAEDLENLPERWGRYLDVDGDGIPYRTYPATHPTKGSYFTRGSSHNAYAAYTESSTEYVDGMKRLESKWDTAKTLVPKSKLEASSGDKGCCGILYYGSTKYPALEAMDKLKRDGVCFHAMRIRSFPFSDEVGEFIKSHNSVFVIEQNRDAQMRSLLVNEYDINPKKLIPVLDYSGMPINAHNICEAIEEHLVTCSCAA